MGRRVLPIVDITFSIKQWGLLLKLVTLFSSFFFFFFFFSLLVAFAISDFSSPWNGGTRKLMTSRLVYSIHDLLLAFCTGWKLCVCVCVYSRAPVERAFPCSRFPLSFSLSLSHQSPLSFFSFYFSAFCSLTISSYEFPMVIQFSKLSLLTNLHSQHQRQRYTEIGNKNLFF